MLIPCFSDFEVSILCASDDRRQLRDALVIPQEKPVRYSLTLLCEEKHCGRAKLPALFGPDRGKANAETLELVCAARGSYHSHSWASRCRFLNSIAQDPAGSTKYIYAKRKCETTLIHGWLDTRDKGEEYQELHSR